MHALLMLLGVYINPVVSSSSSTDSDNNSTFSDIDEFEEMTTLPPDNENSVQPSPSGPSYPSPINVYRRWLYQILGIPLPTEPPAEFEEAFSQFDEWVLINKITREDPVFTDMWDPLASGDWSLVASNRLPPPVVPTSASVEEEEETVGDESLHVLTDPDGLLRWSFSTTHLNESDREIERMALWMRQVARLYNDSLPSYLESVVSPISDSVVEAIHLDVDRTRPVELRDRMVRILMAYAYRNPSVGFCQGMTYLISALLQQSWMTDEDVFKAFSVLIENVNTDYYDNSLSGVRSDLRRLEILVIQKMPWIPPVPLALVLVEPLMCLYTRVVSIDTSIRILDVAFSLNREGLFAVYMALLDLSSRAIQESQRGLSPQEIMTSVNAAVTFREELVRIGSSRDELNVLLQRAEGYLLSHRASIVEILATQELPEDIQWVISTRAPSTRVPLTTLGQPSARPMNDMRVKFNGAASRFMSSWSSFKSGMKALLDEDDDD